MSFQANEAFRFIRNAPFFKLLVPFGLGILCYYSFADNLPLPFLAALLICISGLLSFNYLPDYSKLKFNLTRGMLLFFLCISSGYLISYMYAVANHPTWYLNQHNEHTHALVRVNAEVEAKPKSVKVVVQVKELIKDTIMHEVSGDAILYLQKSEQASQLQVGDHLLIPHKFNAIQSPSNPGSFDYARYSQRNQLYESAYLTTSEWKKTGTTSTNTSAFFIKSNQWTRSVLKKYISDSTSLGLAEALLVGYRKNMDEDLTQAYSNAGIVHIVAISGMHVALVYNAFRALLFLIPFFKLRKSWALLIAVLFMWVFAGVTGMPASVMRAAVMLSFIAFGEMTDRKMSIYNNLALSAFVLLCFNPSWLFDVGFQLSYLAVLSLVIFYQPIYNWLFVANKWLDKIWQLIAVTLAAQVLTFPLCIYYFHQFPLIFVITNLIAVPATTIIIFAEIALLVFAFIPAFASLLGQFISIAISWLNKMVIEMSQWKFSVYDHLQIDLLQVILLYGMISFLTFWLLKNHKFSFIGSLSCFALFLIIQVYIRYQTIDQEKILVFQTPKYSTLAFIRSEEAITANSDSADASETVQKYTLEPAFNSMYVTAAKMTKSTSQNLHIEAFTYLNKRIARLLDTKFNLPAQTKFDIAILTKDCQIDANWFQQNISCKQLVLDGSVPTWKVEKWKNMAKELKIPIHCTSEQGAFVTNLSE